MTAKPGIHFRLLNIAAYPIQACPVEDQYRAGHSVAPSIVRRQRASPLTLAMDSHTLLGREEYTPSPQARCSAYIPRIRAPLA